MSGKFICIYQMFTQGHSASKGVHFWKYVQQNPQISYTRCLEHLQKSVPSCSIITHIIPFLIKVHCNLY